MKRIAEELNDEQLERLDELDNAAYELALVVSCMAGENDDEAKEDDKLEWDMEFIEEIVESAVDTMAEYLKDRGRKIYWPCIVRNEDGASYSYDYYGEDEEEESQERNVEKDSKTNFLKEDELEDNED